MARVISEGEARDIFRRSSGVYIPTGITFYENLYSDYAQIYRTQASVRMVVSFLARNIAQLGLKVYRRISNIEREEVNNHPASLIIKKPNPYETKYRLIYGIVSDIAIYDNAYLLKIRTDLGKLGIVRIPPWQVVPEGGWYVPDIYVVNTERGQIKIERENMIHFPGYNPRDPRSGLSPLESLRQVLAEEFSSSKYRESFWRNSARFEGIIERPVEAPRWTKDARETFREQWQAKFAGGTSSGQTVVLEDGMKFQPISFSAKDSQYIEARKLTREEVASAYHIPPPMVGILDHASFSNIQEQHKMLYQDTLSPWLSMIEDELQLQLLPEFEDTENLYYEFNIHEKLKGSFEEQAKSFQTMVGAPIMTRNEARARLNLPPMPGGDSLVTPLNVLIGGQASPTDSAKAIQKKAKAMAPEKIAGRIALREAHRKNHRELLSRFFKRQLQVIRSKLGAKKSSKAKVDEIFDTDRWNRELRELLFSLSYETAMDFANLLASQYRIEFDETEIIPFLEESARRGARKINRVTKEKIAEILEEEDMLEALSEYEETLDGRIDEISATRAGALSNFGAFEGAKQAGVREKVWVVTSGRPRPSHAAVNGETVPIREPFSLGGMWPGDYSMGAEEVANCTCIIDFV